RPGEKLYEELLNDKENTTNTYHEKILIAKVRGVDYSLVQQELTILRNLMNHHDCNMLLVAKMKELVPEFVSNNSVF
ncbi:polysaccharide biosynthesis protein, partial [Acinetobacter baumannii]